MNTSVLSAESWWSGEEEDDENNVTGIGSSSVYTVSTSHTTSSRKRRPGAAKSRLAQAKEAEHKAARRHNGGWEESMQAAAASNQRVWERQGGWLDYDDKETVENDLFHHEAPPAAASLEKINIPLHVFAKLSKSRKNTRGTTKDKDKENDGTANDIFFPVDWEKDSKELQELVASTTTTTTATATAASQPKEAPKGDLRWSKPPLNKKTNAILWDLADPSGGFSSAAADSRKKAHQRQARAASPTSSTAGKEQSVGRRKRSTQSLSPPRAAQRTTEPAWLSPPRRTQRQTQRQPMPQNLSGDAVSNSLSRSKGWVETMRAATASLSRGGHSWDPKHGFANLDATSVSDVITIESPSRPSARKVEQQPNERQQQQQKAKLSSAFPLAAVQQQRESPANVLEKMIADRRKNGSDPPGRKNATNDSSRDFFVESDLRPATSSSIRRRADLAEAKLLQGLQQHRELRTEEESQEQMSSAEDVQSTIQEQIEVIFKSGTSDAGKARNYGIAALNFEEDEDYLLRAPMVVTPNVPVKKEKVAAEDFDLFPKSRETGTQPRVSPVGARARVRDHNPAKAKVGKDDKAAPVLARRRSDGPVDVDEVDAQSASSDETTETSNVWGSAAENDSFLQGSISSIVRRQSERAANAGAERHVEGPSQDSQPKRKSPVSWAAHAKRLSQNVRGNSDLKEPASNVESLFEIMKGSGKTSAGTKPSLAKIDSKHSIFREKDNKSGGRGKPNNDRAVPGEIATDDSSHVSAESSVTAGWKSFLNKKVQAESAAAAKLQEQGKNGEAKDMQTKETKIKKSVTFESDLSDSLLDSLFDFSASDFKSQGSPVRKSRNALREDSPPSSPYRQRLNDIRERRGLDSPNRERVQSRVRPAHANRSFGVLADSPSRPRASSRTTSYGGDGYPPNRAQNQSFGDLTDMSALTHFEEKEEDGAVEVQQSSFFKRLAECRAPTAPNSQHGLPALDISNISEDDEDSKEAPIAYQWYLQSKQASEKVENMMTFLRARQPISSCASRQRANARNSQTAERVDPTWKQSDITAGGSKGSTGSDRSRQYSTNSTKDESKDPGRAAEELARARVEAMVETLYYASLDEETG